jgi:hypothetical protein
MFRTILTYLWERRTTVLGYVVTTLGILAASSKFTQSTVEWFLLINGIITALLGHYNNRQLPVGGSSPKPQGGFVLVGSLLQTLGILGLVALLLGGCTANPVKEAESFEQKAYALYGVYVISQGKAAALFQDPAVPEKAKLVLKVANDRSYPVAVSLVDAAEEVGEIRTVLDQCSTAVEPDPVCVPTNEQRLTNAINNLSTIYFRAQPVLLGLVAAVKGAK